MSILDKLTEGIVGRDLRKEGDALLNKWEKTGLLEGIDNDANRQGMARLLENQAAQLLKEAATTMSGGSVEGFASVAFPLVRRVFGGLLANDIVSVQPMSLPSGLIFFLDFTFDSARVGNASGESLYGGNVVGAGLTGGVDLTMPYGERSFYSLNNGYSSPTGTLTADGATAVVVATGYTTDGGKPGSFESYASGWNKDSILQFDPDIQSGSSFGIISVPWAPFDTGSQLNQDNLISISGTVGNHAGGGFLNQVRRLTRKNFTSQADYISDVTHDRDSLLFTFVSDAAGATIQDPGNLSGTLVLNTVYDFAITDNFVQGTGQPGSVLGTTTWGLENNESIPEIDIKVDSVAVTAVTKKLKAKWTPELGQDLNAYHNLDAEVELTSILSEQIALEIDREILEDLVKGSSAGTYYWARSPGLFVNRTTGVEVGASSAAPDFTGTVSEWYETLVETINDVSAQIHRKTLRGGANFIVVSPEVANILEFTSGFRASVTHDADRGSIGAVNVGSLSKKFDVYVDPYFPRNVVLVGRKGGSFLESGYVYAPYVPLQVTPTIFGVEDFVPRKGVMTRYAKKMVRPDMYGLVVIADFNG